MQPLSSSPNGRESPSIVEALVRVFEAGQRIVVNRVDLVRYDLAQVTIGALRGTALIAVGAVLVVCAWFALMAGIVVWLNSSFSLAISLALVGGVNALGGAALIAAGVARAKPDVRFDYLFDNPTDGAVGRPAGRATNGSEAPSGADATT